MSNCFVSLRQGSTHFIFLNKQGKAQINILFIFIFRFLYPTLLLICQLTYMSQFLLTNREFIEMNPKIQNIDKNQSEQIQKSFKRKLYHS